MYRKTKSLCIQFQFQFQFHSLQGQIPSTVMAHSSIFEISIPPNPSPFNPLSFHGDIITTHHPLTRRTFSSSSSSYPPLTTKRNYMKRNHSVVNPTKPLYHFSLKYPQASNISTARVEEQVEVEVAKGYTMTQFCDKMIEVFMKEKPQTKEWRKLLVLREEWNKYKDNFYNRCQARADAETDSVMKQALIRLRRKVKKIDEEMERHGDLLKEIQENPTDINEVVARRRKDFTGEFFRHLTLLSEIYDGLEDRDAMARLGAKCLSAVCAYDNAVEHVEMFDAAQSKFDDILNSPSLDAACEKIKGLAKAKELDSSLILLINKAWASAKDSTTLRSEVKDIMYRLYKTTKSSLRSMTPKEIKLLKYLLNITDPEERFSALATAFSPGDEHKAKDVNALYTTPKELHKWIKIMLDAYQINREETDLREARQMSDPMVIQRLFILKETIEEEYMKRRTDKERPEMKEAEENSGL